MEGDRAIVVGGSMTGMLAARVLADHVAVTIVERDALPDGVHARRGLPQATHLHTILDRGMALLERLFPALRGELLRDGAVAVDGGTEVGWLGPFGWAAPFRRGALESIWATRDFLDAHVRDRLRRHPRVDWIENTRVESLALDPSRRNVRGVVTADGRVLGGSLVVDATGRGSKLPDWLRAAGFAAPAETEIDSRTVYTSAFARLRAPFPMDWKIVFILGQPPQVLRAAAIGPVEGGRVLVSLATVAGEPAPEDTAGFAAFGRSLRAPFVGDVFENAEWLTPARSTRSTANRKRHYERIALPPGLIVMGDALCAFNPVFGQGISVAAMQAEALSRLLRRHGLHEATLGSLATRQFLRVVAFPWAMATSQDLQIPGTRGSPSLAQPIINAYLNRVFSLSTREGDVNLATSRVFNLSVSPLALCEPRLALRALRERSPSPQLGPVAPPGVAAVPVQERAPLATAAGASRTGSRV
jgi:2-polyprenyl-6-methoxyphenol hydroxylase-like FAD-dependent oxidoreductase